MASSFDRCWSVHRLATDRSCLIYSSGSCDVFCQWREFYLCVQGMHWDKWRSAASSVGWNNHPGPQLSSHIERWIVRSKKNHLRQRKKAKRRMASQGGQGDGWPVNSRSFPMNPSHLPPKIPAFPGFGSAQVLESTAAGHSSVSLIHGGIHKRTPSAGYLSQVLQLDFPFQFQVCIMCLLEPSPNCWLVFHLNTSTVVQRLQLIVGFAMLRHNPLGWMKYWMCLKACSNLAPIGGLLVSLWSFWIQAMPIFPMKT